MSLPCHLQGAWLWTWKDRIDRKWMSMYGDGLWREGMGRMSTGSVSPRQDSVAVSVGPEALAALAAAKMRCGGCGAKVTSYSRQNRKQETIQKGVLFVAFVALRQRSWPALLSSL